MVRFVTTTPKMQDLIKKTTWYHTISLGNGIVTKGVFDHRNIIDKYGFPDNLEGKIVLDIGASSGFFSFEFERRRAKRVLATDVRWEDQDIADVVKKDGFLATSSSGILSSHKQHGLSMSSFQIAKKVLNSTVEHKELSAYDISPQSVGLFDFVFCGSLLLHLTDNFKVIKNICDVTKEFAIIATCIEDLIPDQPVARFLNNTSDRVFWIPNMKCLTEMAKAAGFSQVEEGEIFDLIHRDGHAIKHGIITCRK